VVEDVPCAILSESTRQRHRDTEGEGETERVRERVAERDTDREREKDTERQTETESRDTHWSFSFIVDADIPSLCSTLHSNHFISSLFKSDNRLGRLNLIVMRTCKK
jgi:hypothetical protein